MLVASMNPCPCGWHGDPRSRCRCTPNDVRRYQAKLSGPLLDRFDLAVEVPAVDPVDLSSTVAGERSERVRDRVHAARLRQQSRFGPQGPASNARMGRAELERHAALAPTPMRILVEACRRLGLTARGYDRVRRVARTLADLDACTSIRERHVAEAVQYRRVVNVDASELGAMLTTRLPKA
jgi:magnesium chelatase family protein